MRREPTTLEINDACLSFRHDFGLLDTNEQDKIRHDAKEWLRAWDKTLEVDQIKDYANAMAEIVKDFLPICPAKHHKMIDRAIELGRKLACNINEENIKLKQRIEELEGKHEA